MGGPRKGFLATSLGSRHAFSTLSLTLFAMSRLTMICHPHTGEKLAAALNDCLVDWGIEAGKVMALI